MWQSNGKESAQRFLGPRSLSSMDESTVELLKAWGFQTYEEKFRGEYFLQLRVFRVHTPSATLLSSTHCAKRGRGWPVRHAAVQWLVLLAVQPHSYTIPHNCKILTSTGGKFE